MRFHLVVFAFVALGSLATAATITVPDDYPTIQGAIDVAANGDTIIVRPGTYVENIDFLGKAITLQSERGPGVTTIDGGTPADPYFGYVVGFVNGEDASAVLEGFTLTNGTGFRVDNSRGGGVYCSGSSPTIRGNVVTMNNVSSRGGGMYFIESSAVISDNVIHANRSHHNGGGIHAEYSSLLIEKNVITANESHDGGGISCSVSKMLVIRNNTIAENIGNRGGAIQALMGTIIISNNVIYDNLATYGGGIKVSTISALIENNVVRDNVAGYGGGISCDTSFHRPLVISGNRIYRNLGLYGGGMDCSTQNATMTIINNTIVENVANAYGGGIHYLLASIGVVNTILWNNVCPNGPEMFPSPYAYYSDVKGGCSGPGNINADPLFADLVNDDFHLTYDSPCIDSGTDLSQYLPFRDFEGDPRKVGGVPDMGADEFYFHLYHAGDVSPGGAMDLRIVGGPGMPVLLGHSLAIEDPPQPTSWGDLFLTMPPAWSSKIGTIPANGVLSFPITVPSFWNPGDEKYFQALVGAPGGAYATLTNLETLEVE